MSCSYTDANMEKVEKNAWMLARRSGKGIIATWKPGKDCARIMAKIHAP